MKKTKSISGTPQSESNSLTHSHSFSESRLSLNDEFRAFPPPSDSDTQRAIPDDEDEDEDEEDDEVEERENEIIVYESGERVQDDEGYEEEDDDDDGDEGEEEEEEEEEEEQGEPEEGEREDDVDGLVDGETSMEKKKLADGFYEVESIRRKRICKGERQYLIKWRGWPESANTWEPVDHLQTCPDVVEAYEESLRSGQKKSSRKRKRKFTQPKKKMQYSYGVSKKHGEAVKRSRAAKVTDYKGSETVSPNVPSNDKESSDQLFGQNASEKNMVVLYSEPMTVEGDGPANCQSNANCLEVGQSNQRRGAKRRKSGSVRRFTQDMTSLSFDYIANAAQGNISSCNRAGELMSGNSEAYRNKEFDSSRSSTVITRLIKPISYSASVTNNVQDVSVTFVAMRSDGKEVMVDNKFLKANNPQLLINFYEQHLRYNPN